MAAPSGQLKASRYFAVLGAIVVVLYALVFLTGDKQPKPKLGLDLQGGTSMTLSATTLDGKPPSSDKLDVARGIIAQRVDSTGVAEAEVVVQGSQNIVVNVAGKNADRGKLEQLVAPAFLDFRAVLNQTTDSPATEPSASPSGPTSPSAAPSASPSGAGVTTPKGSPSATPSATPSAKPSATPSTTPSAPAAPTPSTTPSAAPSPSGSTPGTPAVSNLDDVKKKVGAAVYQLGAGITDPSSVDPATLAQLAPFTTKLDPADVAALPVSMQFNIPTVTCDQLNRRIPGTITTDAALKQQVVACDQAANAHTKYLLDIAKVQGKDISSASSTFDVQQGGWIVNLSFQGSGQGAWTKLTQDAKNAEAQDGRPHQVAIVLDNQVVSAPNIVSVIPGPAVINGGNINQKSAKLLSTQLKFGSLPLSFQTLSVDNVSATLGLAQMKAGLLAGAIGLALVVLYCLVYYRALGFVVIASLVASATVVFASLVLLGRSMGFTLSLAGIAGFIVAIGITADSFVVFFERLKDEVKDGRTVRSAVPRAWQRARRTILSADAVSLLAAIVLFILASGPVAGFAFTLGLSTIIDLLIVFLFTHPLVSVLSGSRTFTSPRFSGLGGLRGSRGADAGTSAGRVGAMRTKES